LISINVWFTEAIWSSNSGWEMSTTCNNKSASRTSSRVLLKESTSCVGNFEWNLPYQKAGKAGFNDYFSDCGIKVAKSLFSTKHHFSRWHSLKLIFPHWYTNRRRTIAPRLPRLYPFVCQSILSFNEILSRTIRLSVSISVSPGPRIPIPLLTL
jgi:hypothetical protein